MENIENIIDFNYDADIDDCYENGKETNKKLTKLGILDYTIRLGNHKVHYLNYQLPKRSDFCPDFNPELSEYDDKYFKQLRKYLKEHKKFMKNTEKIVLAKKILKEWQKLNGI